MGASLSWRAIVAPTAALVVSVGAAAAVFPESRRPRTEAAALRAEASAYPLLAAFNDAQRDTAQVYLRIWHGAAQFADDSDVSISDLQQHRSRLEPLLPKRSDRDTLNAAYKALEAARGNPDSKVEIGAVGQLSIDLGRLASTATAGASSSGVASLQRAGGATDSVISLDQNIVALRLATGIDPMPANVDLERFVRGYAAGLGPPDKDVTNLVEAFANDIPRDDELGQQILATLGRSELRSFADEARWALTSRETNPNPQPQLAFTRSAHDAIDAVADEVDAAVVRFEQRAKERARALDRRATATQAAAAAAGVGAVLSLLWLLARVAHTIASLRRESERDPLTALLNRAGLRARANLWLGDRSSTPIALGVIDLDRFKQVNDTLGHHAGDEVLRIVANRVTDQVVASTTAVARWGGDEFVVLLQLRRDGAIDDVASVFDRIRIALALPVELGEDIIAMSGSVGASLCSCGGCDVDDLFRSADRLLYDVKRAGRDAVAIGPCGGADEHESAAITDPSQVGHRQLPSNA
jgi:diguanylate cyclase (GGDEF)-like protein